MEAGVHITQDQVAGSATVKVGELTIKLDTHDNCWWKDGSVFIYICNEGIRAFSDTVRKTVTTMAIQCALLEYELLYNFL